MALCKGTEIELVIGCGSLHLLIIFRHIQHADKNRKQTLAFVIIGTIGKVPLPLLRERFIGLLHSQSKTVERIWNRYIIKSIERDGWFGEHKIDGEKVNGKTTGAVGQKMASCGLARSLCKMMCVVFFNSCCKCIHEACFIVGISMWFV